MPLTLNETEKLIALIESMREVPPLPAQPTPTPSVIPFTVAQAELPRSTTPRPLPSGWIMEGGVYTLSADRPYLRIEADDVDLNLNGYHIDSIVCGQTRELHRVRVRGGSAGSLFFDRRPHEDTTIHQVMFSGAETAIFPHGQRITVDTCSTNVSGSGYALFIGDVAYNSDLRITNCHFMSQGPNSLVRICNTDNVFISHCTFNEELYHHLRFHGYSRLCTNIWVEDCVFNGTGNGVGVGFDSGAGEQYGCKDVTFYRCNLAVGGPDKANFDRNRGGAHAQNVRVIECEGDWT